MTPGTPSVRWPARTIEERFFEKTCPEPNTGCLLWTAALNECGYGEFKFAHRVRQLAHRVAFFIAYGRWPQPQALHRCDTPACVNIAHLFEGTDLDNARDKMAKGRDWQSSVTHCPRGHAYDEVNTALYGGRRYCRTCNRERKRT